MSFRRYRIEFLASAIKALTGLQRRDQEAIKDLIDSLSDNPTPPGAKKLKGQSPAVWRVRAGDYRVLYQIDGKEIVVLIIKIAPRREVYRR